MKAVLVKPKGEAARGVGYYSTHLFESINKLNIQSLNYQEYSAELFPRDADLIHFPYFYPYFRSLPLNVNKRFVVTVHDLIPIRFQKYFPPGIKGTLVWNLQKYNLKKVGAIVTDSECSKKDIIEFTNLNPDKIHVIYLSSDEIFKSQISGEDIQNVRKKYNLPPDFLLFTGGVNWNKNINGLVKACKYIGINLVIVGKEAVMDNYDTKHKENQSLASLQQEFGNDPMIRRVGFVPSTDLLALYKLAKAYVQPSFYEGFGLPILEAFNAGCLVASSNQGSLPEIYGDAAVSFNPYDVEEMMEKIKSAINLSNTAKAEYINRGFVQSQKFSWEKTAKKTIDVYKKLHEVS